MTEAVYQRTTAQIRASSEARLRRRHAAERRFRAYGLIAIITAGAILALLLGNIMLTGQAPSVSPSSSWTSLSTRS